MTRRPISVVIPAHNEANVIGRLLSRLTSGCASNDEIIVVCNGCDDKTAQVAREFVGVKVLESAMRGKTSALNLGDSVAKYFPRFYVDADIIVERPVLHGIAAMLVGGTLAGSPRARFDLTNASWAVRSYYAFWSMVPYFRASPLGSGIFGLSEGGRRRFEQFPDVIADDLFVYRQFSRDERVKDPSGTFTITPPRRMRDLVKIKTRAKLGIFQLDSLGVVARDEPALSGRMQTLRLLRDFHLWVPFVVFTAVRVLANVCARWQHLNNSHDQWARDDTSREV